jgi:hypothetical protein
VSVWHFNRHSALLLRELAMKRFAMSALFLALLVGCSKEAPKSKAPATKPNTANLTTGNLLQLYGENAAKADESYKGKYVKLTGLLHKIIKLEDGRQAAVVFKEFMLEPGDDGYVCAIIPDDQLDMFKQLQDGEKCVVAGKCTGRQEPVAGSPLPGPGIVLEQSWVDMKQIACSNCKEKFYAVDSATRVICPHCKTELRRK